MARDMSDILASKSSKGMVDNILQRLEIGQQQLSEKIDLQLQRLDEVLQLKQRGQIHLHSSEVPTVSYPPSLQRGSHAPESQEIHPDSGNTLLRRGTLQSFAEEVKSKQVRDLKAYQGAMGWQKTCDNMFRVDPSADFITRFASGPYWAFLCIALIVVSTIIVGIETHLSTAHAVNQALSTEGATVPPTDFNDGVFQALELAFLIWMTFELLVNAYAQRWDFICGKEWRWNAFDVFVVFFSLVMQILQYASVSFLRVTRVARLFRMGKFLRAFRVVKFLRSIRSMLISISGSILHLLSALLVMCTFMLVVSLVIMQGISNDLPKVPLQPSSNEQSSANLLDDSSQLSIPDIAKLYGSVPKTMMTLFITVTGGFEWSKAAGPIVKLDLYYGVIWTAYIAFMVFGLLNVLTGIFVETAMSAMNGDRDNMIQAQLEERENLISAITTVFMTSDTNGSGQMTEQEMDVILQDPEVVAYFHAIGVDTTEAMGLFQLLDDDGSGTVSIDEFVTGFLRLKGSAKAVDMVTLMYENRKISKLLKHICSEQRKVQNMVTALQQGVRSPAGSWAASV